MGHTTATGNNRRSTCSSPNQAFIRITDADMMILDRNPFLPPMQSSGVDIDIFNGLCCGKRMYPMHSVGKKTRIWRELFSPDHSISNTKSGSESIEKQLAGIKLSVKIQQDSIFRVLCMVVGGGL